MQLFASLLGRFLGRRLLRSGLLGIGEALALAAAEDLTATAVGAALADFLPALFGLPAAIFFALGLPLPKADSQPAAYFSLEPTLVIVIESFSLNSSSVCG